MVSDLCAFVLKGSSVFLILYIFTISQIMSKMILFEKLMSVGTRKFCI
jgi:hypothetical protein